MRKLKSLILMSLFTFVLLFSTTAFAAEMLEFDPVKYTEGENVTVKLYIGDTELTKIKLYGAIAFRYDGEVFEYVDGTTGQSDGTIYDYSPDPIIYWTNESSDITVDHSKPLCEITFKVKDGVDKAEVYGKKFYIDADNTMFTDPATNADYEYNIAEVTVEADAPASNVQATMGDDGIITVTGDSALVGKYILVNDTALPNDATLSAVSRFVVKNTVSNKTQSYNIFEALKVEGLDGSIATKNIKFGIVSNNALNASEFEFSFEGIN